MRPQIAQTTQMKCQYFGISEISAKSA